MTIILRDPFYLIASIYSIWRVNLFHCRDKLKQMTKHHLENLQVNRTENSWIAHNSNSACQPGISMNSSILVVSSYVYFVLVSFQVHLNVIFSFDIILHSLLSISLSIYKQKHWSTLVLEDMYIRTE